MPNEINKSDWRWTPQNLINIILVLIAIGSAGYTVWDKRSDEEKRELKEIKADMAMLALRITKVEAKQLNDDALFKMRDERLDWIRAEIGSAKAELKADISSLRSDLYRKGAMLPPGDGLFHYAYDLHLVADSQGQGGDSQGGATLEPEDIKQPYLALKEKRIQSQIDIISQREKVGTASVEEIRKKQYLILEFEAVKMQQIRESIEGEVPPPLKDCIDKKI